MHHILDVNQLMGRVAEKLEAGEMDFKTAVCLTNVAGKSIATNVIMYKYEELKTRFPDVDIPTLDKKQWGKGK